MMLRNIPVNLQSKLGSVFLLAMWLSADVKTYGYDQLLRPIVDSLKELESGMHLNIQGERRIIKGALVLFSADNLGAHSVFVFFRVFQCSQILCCV